MPKPHKTSWPTAVRLHQLEGFFHVARSGGYARAVAALPYAITEPALHQQVRKLERALGARLLESAPGRRRMVLTPSGRTVLRFVTPYFEQLPGVLRSVAERLGRTLVVATEPLYIEGLCAPALGVLRSRDPTVELRLLELSTEDVGEVLLSGSADVGLALGAEVAGRGLVFQRLGELGLSLLLPPKHPLARRRPPLRPDHLRGERFVVYPPATPGRRLTESVLALAEVPLTIAAEAASAAAMRSLVRAGVGLAFVPAFLSATPPVRRKTLPDGVVAFDLTGMLRQYVELPAFGVFRRASSEPGGLVDDFCSAVRAQLARRR